MLALARIFVLVKGGAVEAAEAVGVAREVGRHPIDEDANAMLVAVIDEVHEVVRRAVTARGSEVTDGLIAPASAEGVLADRQQLDVRKAHLDDVLHELMRKLAVAKPAMRVVAGAPPTSQMDLVDADRAIECLRGGAIAQVGFVAPVIARKVEDLRGGARRHFGA